MAPTPDIAVVIPAHDAAATIEAQLDAVAIAMKDAPPAEVIVVDNRSTDDTVDRIRQWRSVNDVDVRIVTAPDGATAAYARNRGAAATEAHTICFCDADDVVDFHVRLALGHRVEMGLGQRHDGIAVGGLREHVTLRRGAGATSLRDDEHVGFEIAS